MLGAALQCLMAIKNIGRAIEHFFCFKCCCALHGEMLDSFGHSIELARFTHAQFRKITEMSPRNNLDTKAGFLFTSQRQETQKCWTECWIRLTSQRRAAPSKAEQRRAKLYASR